MIAGDLKNTAEELKLLLGLAQSGQYRAVSDRTFDLTQVVEAHRYVDTGPKRGNVVLHIASAESR